jgi:hypothetical protein
MVLHESFAFWKKRVKRLTHKLDMNEEKWAQPCRNDSIMCKIHRRTIKISLNAHFEMVTCVFSWNLNKGAHYPYLFLHPMLMKPQRLLDCFVCCTCKEMVKSDFVCLLSPTPRGEGIIASNKLSLVKIVI